MTRSRCQRNAQRLALHGEQPAPDPVLAEVPGPQGKFQTVLSDGAGCADRNRLRGLTARCGYGMADGEPQVRVEAAARAAGL